MKFSFTKFFKCSQSLFCQSRSRNTKSISDFICHRSLHCLLFSLLFSFSPPLTMFINMNTHKSAKCLILVILSLEVVIPLLGHFSLNATFPHCLLLFVFPRMGACRFPDTSCSHLAQMIISAS